MVNAVIGRLGTTIFEAMSQRARDTGAINLGQGFPDANGPPELLEACARAVLERSSQYPPMRGLAELRRSVAEYYRAGQGIVLDPDTEIVVTSGATEALAASLLALIEPGDEVIAVQPLYDAYLPLIERAGGVVRLVSLTPPDWRLPVAVLEAAITPRTRLLLLNTPNNPTGTILGQAELEAVARLCVAHDLNILCDEVWEAMLFDAVDHRSPLALPELRDRTVKVGSAGKIFSLTGWKVGWACAAPPLATAIARAHQFLTFTTPPALQWAVSDGLSLPAEWHAAHRAGHGEGRARLIAGLRAAGFHVLDGPATWFVIVDLAASGIDMPDTVFCERLAEAGVVSIPVSAFYADAPETGYVRFCFTKSLETLDEAIARIGRFRGTLA
ncbi:MAG: aminotransferase [Sphingobium sp.]|nr:MAG: aminotransferase [Sphingobium sp.]